MDCEYINKVGVLELTLLSLVLEFQGRNFHARGRSREAMVCNHIICNNVNTNHYTYYIRSYKEGIRLGYLTKDPSKFNNASVCEPYISS